MPSPIDIQKALAGMEYPASKEQIVQHAERNGADDEVLNALRGIADRQYDGPSGVSSSVFD